MTTRSAELLPPAEHCARSQPMTAACSPEQTGNACIWRTKCALVDAHGTFSKSAPKPASTFGLSQQTLWAIIVEEIVHEFGTHLVNCL